MIKGLVCFLGLLAVVYGQSCDIAAIHSCMKPDEADLPQQHSTPSTSDMEAKKQQGIACFTSAGCKAPTMPEKSNNGAAKNENMETVVSCFKQIHDQAQTDIETCVKAKFPNFNFPAFNQSQAGWQHGPMGGKGGKGGMKENIEKFIQKALSESCPDEASKKTVTTCLKGLFEAEAGKHEDKHFDGAAGAFNFTNIKAKMCEKKKKCFDTLSADCQTELKAVQAQVCTCVKSEIAEKNDTFKTQIKACLPTPPAGLTFTTPSSSALAALKSKFAAMKDKIGAGASKIGASASHEEHEDHAKKGMEGIQNLVDMICNEPKDPCAA